MVWRSCRGAIVPITMASRQRRPTYHRCVADSLPAGVAADDGCALHFQGTTLVAAVASRPAARAYRVERSGDDVSETPLPTRFLG